MTGHTKGPWVTDLELTGHVMTSEGIAIHDHPDYSSIRDHNQIKANSRLIAAAPDLLEALIDCRRALEIANFTQELAIVNAAIAKAQP